MPLLYDKWQVGIAASFHKTETDGGLLFVDGDRSVTARRFGDGRSLSKQEGIARVKAEANPRHVTLFEKNDGMVYLWAYKHAEELEAISPWRHLVEANYVVEGEILTIVAAHASRDDHSWADGVVRMVRYLHDWKVQRSVGVTAIRDRLVVTSHSRRDDGMWVGNGFQRLLPAVADAAALGKLVRLSLARCRRGVKTRSASLNLKTDAEFLRLAGVETAWQISSWAKVIRVEVEDSVVNVMPTWAGRGYAHVDAWFLPMNPIPLPLDCSPEELGEAVLRAKELCAE